MRIATRGSPLALWQARHIAAQLTEPSELVIVETLGDARRDVPIAALGGTGAFVAEVRNAVLEGRADLAVHSAKDLPAGPTDGLVIAAVPRRGDPRDALVGSTVAELPEGAVVGTGSARRRVQMAHLRPDLEFALLRGNIETRLSKVGAGFDAVIVAAAALERLDLLDRAAEIFDVDSFVPQAAQGALAVECRADDRAAVAAVAGVEDPSTRVAVDCERAFLEQIGAGCGAPVGAYAVCDGAGDIRARAVLGDAVAGLQRAAAEGTDPRLVGLDLARQLSAFQVAEAN